MAQTFVEYPADGATTDFSVPFEYLDKDYVKVFLDDVETVAFSFLDAGTVRLDAAPANGVVVKIQRETPRNVRLVDFQDGSVLTESSLDTAVTQTLHVVQEAYDNLGAEARDAIAADKAQTEEWRDEARAWATEAEDTQVDDGENPAGYSAFHWAQKASAHEGAAETAQTAAEAASDKAQKWAEEVEDTEVEPGLYSAKHHAAKAAASAASIDPAQFVKKDGSVAMTGPLTLSGDPTNPLEAAPKQYVDAAGFVPQVARCSGGSTSVPGSTWTLLDISSAQIDPDSIVDTALNRITPTVAGYYLVAVGVKPATGLADTARIYAGVAKSGLFEVEFYNKASGNSTDDQGVYGTILVYFNGTTDYLEIWGYHNSAGNLLIQTLSVARVG